MSNRRELLKKTLGITEYPWSSDEDDGAQQDNSNSSLPRRQPSEPRQSMADMPGTSGNLLPQSRPIPSPSVQPPRAPGEQVARRDRDMFWSLLNNPRRSSLFSVQRPTHTPAPDLIERPNEGSPNADMQRMLAFKRFSRNNWNMRPRMKPNNTFYAVPSTRPNQGSSMGHYPMFPPSTSQSTGNMHPRSSRCYGFKRTRPVNASNHNPRVNADGPSPAVDVVPSSSGMAPTDLIPATATNDAPLNQNISADNNIDISNSDEDIEMSCPSTSETTVNNDINAEQDNAEHVEGVAQNTSDGGISLEEEIVEIDAPEVPNANEVPDIDVEAISNNDDETKEVLSILRDIHQDNITEQSGQAHSIKRKREGSADINTPYSVKEFNQSLLRLLECPVCLEWMEPPISQCRRGHLVCSRCRARLASCPVCRTMFSSVRNRAMEGVAEMLRYPCRHGCGREVRLRRRAPHEASCSARKYHCPAPACTHRHPLPRDQLATHFQSKHLSMLKIGALHKFTMKVNSEQHDNWLIMTLDEFFHLRVDIDIRTWGVIVYVAYIGPKCNASNYVYEVTVDGHQNARKLTYTRVTHSDLESSTMSMGRQDCFHLSLDQAVNFLRFTSRNCDSDKFLDFNVEVKKCVQPVDTKDDVDS
ncbi:E3 ubiquitin-protein ligase sina isoform X1 [Manduca sexta]|uniref:E3 ubiquitin-protein ligase sina isoform X1 n=1 Tax=Manduca sexta TaxID=7130 RepID=UPI00188FD92D|nr:E3 ubiquitin-protein ligase sina isoform X1 [Manduca sexta]